MQPHSHAAAPSLTPSFFARPSEVVAPELLAHLEGEDQQLIQALLLLKRSRCLNISAFCREAIAEKLEHLEVVK